MTLPAGDSFTGLTAGTLLATWSANWTNTRNTLRGATGGGAVYAGSSDDTIGYWNADTFGNNQYSQVDANLGGGQYLGVAVRAVTTNNNCYGYYIADNDGAFLFKWSGNTWTQMGGKGATASGAVTLRIEASGDTITPKKNGSIDTSIGAQTDSSLASGSAGIVCYGVNGAYYVDNWEGGNLSLGQLAADNFERASLGANWSSPLYGTTAPIIVNSSDASGNTNLDTSAYWSADSFNASQYSKGVVSTGFSGWPGVAVRMASDRYCYALQLAVASNVGDIFKYTGGNNYTSLAQPTTYIVAGDTLYIEAVGDQVACKVNGSTIFGPTTDSSLSSGSAGIYFYAANSAPMLESWEGGNVSSGLNVNKAETAAAAETVGVSLSAPAINVSDSATAAESAGADLPAAGTLTVSVSDSATAADAATVSGLAVSTLSASVTDSAAVTDSPGVAMATEHYIDVGFGFLDGTAQQIVRTSDNRLWLATWKFDTYPEGNHPTGLGQTLRMYKADQTGQPATFSRIDSVNEPVDVVSWAIAVDGSDTIHVLWTKRASWTDASNYGVDNYLYYCTFNTATGTWGAPSAIETALGITEYGQGDELCSMVLDRDGVPHIAYMKYDGTRRRVTYRNRIGGSWSSPVTVDDQAFGANEVCWHPGVFLDRDDRIAVVWMRGATSFATARIFIRVNEGGTWGTTHDVSGAGLYCGIDTVLRLYVTPTDNRYHLAYLDASKYIQYRYSDDRGGTWTANHPGSGTTFGDDPVCGPGPNGTVRIYAHGGSGTNIAYWQGNGGSGSWGTQLNYITATGFDCTVNIRHTKYFRFHPGYLDVAYWLSTYPSNEAYVGLDMDPAPTLIINRYELVTAGESVNSAREGAALTLTASQVGNLIRLAWS